MFEQFSDKKIINTFDNISDWLWSCDLPQQTMLTKCRDRDKLWKVGYLSKALGDKFEDKKWDIWATFVQETKRWGYLRKKSELKKLKSDKLGKDDDGLPPSPSSLPPPLICCRYFPCFEKYYFPATRNIIFLLRGISFLKTQYFSIFVVAWLFLRHIWCIVISNILNRK